MQTEMERREEFPIDEVDLFLIPMMGDDNMNKVIHVDTNLDPKGLAGLQSQVEQALVQLGASLDSGEVESGAVVGTNNIVYAVLKREGDTVFGILVDGGLNNHYYKRAVKTGV